MNRKYKLIFTKEFLKQLKNIDKQTKIRILKAMKTLEEKPFAGKRLRGPLTGLYSLRIGNYRVIYQPAGPQLIIRTVGHRKTIYKK